ncbi:MAG TPA: hypothetical protein VK467_06890 [Gemmatimonadales bacterium]|jgi:hypothetical protein|nr:hypothetical protein [Gemmatimonadales bacterium]
MLRAPLFAVLITTLLSAACGKDGPGPNGPLTGDWEGLSGQETITMTLTQSGGTISGTGFIYNGQAATTLTLTGTHASPYVNMHFAPANYVAWDFSGRLASGDSLAGVFNGSGFTNFGVVFVRQP